MALHMFLNTIAHRNVLFLLYFYIPDIHVQNFVISAIRSFPPWILPSIYPVRGKFFRPASLYVFHKFDLSLSYFMYNCLFFLHLSSELPTLDPCIFCVLLYNNNFDTSSQWENCPAFTVIMHSISALFYLFLTRFERNFPVFFFWKATVDIPIRNRMFASHFPSSPLILLFSYLQFVARNFGILLLLTKILSSDN